MNNINLELMYKWCENKADQRKVKKIINASFEMNQENFWEIIKKMTRNVRSDHSIKRWQIFAEMAERILFN